MASGTRQVNARLSAATFEILEAAAFAHGTTTATLLAELAEDAAEDWKEDRATQIALKAREEGMASKRGNVRSIDSRGGAKGARNGRKQE